MGRCHLWYLLSSFPLVELAPGVSQQWPGEGATVCQGWGGLGGAGGRPHHVCSPGSGGQE